MRNVAVETAYTDPFREIESLRERKAARKIFHSEGHHPYEMLVGIRECDAIRSEPGVSREDASENSSSRQTANPLHQREKSVQTYRSSSLSAV